MIWYKIYLPSIIEDGIEHDVSVGTYLKKRIPVAMMNSNLFYSIYNAKFNGGVIYIECTLHK